MHGDDLCAELVAAGCRSRVLMLTAAATAADLVDGLGLGADDYLPKPFDFPVLVARIGALARRAHPGVPPVLRHGDLVVDAPRRRACRAGRPLELSPKELGVLELLAAAYARAGSVPPAGANGWTDGGDAGGSGGTRPPTGSPAGLQVNGPGAVKLSPGQAQAVARQTQALAASQHTSELHQLLIYSGIALAIM